MGEDSQIFSQQTVYIAHRIFYALAAMPIYPLIQMGLPARGRFSVSVPYLIVAHLLQMRLATSMQLRLAPHHVCAYQIDDYFLLAPGQLLVERLSCWH